MDLYYSVSVCYQVVSEQVLTGLWAIEGITSISFMSMWGIYVNGKWLSCLPSSPQFSALSLLTSVCHLNSAFSSMSTTFPRELRDDVDVSRPPGTLPVRLESSLLEENKAVSFLPASTEGPSCTSSGGELVFPTVMSTIQKTRIEIWVTSKERASKDSQSPSEKTSEKTSKKIFRKT